MKIISTLENDWKLINYQQSKINKCLKKRNIYLIFHSSINPILTLILFIVLAIVLGIILNEYTIQLLLFWLMISLCTFFMRIIKLSVSMIPKISLVYIVIFISIILIFKKDYIGDFIGSNYIQGYSSWYEDSFNIHAETEYTEHYFKTDTWVGSFILNCFSFLYFPFLILIPYLTWKQITKL